jgi:hypothetical protein
LPVTGEFQTKLAVGAAAAVAAEIRPPEARSIVVRIVVVCFMVVC